MEKSRHGAFVHIQKVLKCSLFLFLLINLLSISPDVSASTTLLEQKYTLNLSFKDARLEQVLDAIMKQSGVKIVYSGSELQKDKRISVEIQTSDILVALHSVLGNGYAFKQIEDYIAIGKKEERAESKESLETSQDKIRIKGTVVDVDNNPIVGATIAVKGSATGVVTDENGHYTISVALGDILEYRYIGFATEERKVKNDSLINIKLKEESIGLGDVVVIGYGTLDKKEITSAVAHISSKDFLNVSSPDPMTQIQGKVAGVSITNTAFGDPNKTSSIQIRGVSSRAAGTGPLIVIDGVPGGNLTNIHSNDIESIDILKDGAAAAIYGTRGGNGVVIINTKKGSKDGKLHTSYSGTVAANFMIRDLKPINAEMYRKYRVANSLGADNGSDTDWLDEVSRTGFTHDHVITLSGGNGNSNYRGSLNYKKSTGIDLRSSREEYGGRFSINHTVKSGLLTFMANVAPRIAYRKSSSGGFSTALTANPTNPVMDPSNPDRYFSFLGEQAGTNPVELAKLEKNGGDTKLLDWDATAKLNLLPLLAKGGESNYTLTTQITYAEQRVDNLNYWFMPSISTRSEKWAGEASRSYEETHSKNIDWRANFSGELNNHKLQAMVGYSYEESVNQGMSVANKDFISDALEYNDIGSGSWLYDVATKGDYPVSSSKTASKLIAFYGRVSYDYKNKYLLTASLRHEGSSRFGKNHKWGNFPAISAGWRISEESFMEDIEWINDLKIRGDYGVTGNQNFSNYQSLSTMRSWGNYPFEGQSYIGWGPAKNPNPDLKWEKAYNWNIGVDYSLFNNRFSGSLNYYHREQRDLLGTYNVPIPPYIFPTTFVNVGTMNNSGFEFEMGVEAVKTSDFSYSVNFVGATNQNKFVSFSNEQYKGKTYDDLFSMEAPGSPGTLQRLEEGKRVGNYYTYAYAGIDEDGDWLVWNKDNTEKIPVKKATEADKRVTGNGLPKFTASLMNTFVYKNWDLSLYFRGAFGFDLFNVHDFYYGLPTSVGSALEKAYGENAHITKGTNILTDYFIEKGDFVKLDVVTLGYRFKTNCKWLEGGRLYVTGRNLATFTGFSGVDPASFQVNGLTPGASHKDYYPSSRQFSFGVQLDF